MDEGAPIEPTVSRRGRTLRRDLRLCTLDGAGYSVMVGVGESHFVLFVLALGAGEATAGLAATLPRVIGGLLQLLSPWAVARLGSNRRWVVSCAVAQSLSFVPLIVGGLVGSMPLWLAFAAIGLYWSAGLATGPAWNSWVTTMIPARLRVPYFARRWRPLQLGTLLGLVGGGLALQVAAPSHDHVGGTIAIFSLLFFVAGLMRGYSSFCLAMQSEPVPAFRAADDLPRASLASIVRGPGAKLLLFMLCVQASVQVSGPYFTPFMRSELEMSYFEIMALTSTAYIAKSISVPLTGRLIRRIGVYPILWAGGIGIIPTAGLWTVSHDFWFLFGIQVLAGLVWGCYEIATFLLLFETIPSARRVRVLTIFNLADALTIAVGSMVGAQILRAGEESVAAFHTTFLLSSGLRCACLVVLCFVRGAHVRAARIVLRTLGVRPNAVPDDRPILATIDAPPEPVAAHPEASNGECARAGVD